MGKLSPRERDVFEHLVAQRPRVCSVFELLDATVGSRDRDAHNLTSVTVTGIRKKLGTGCVRTVRGKGYQAVL